MTRMLLLLKVLQAIIQLRSVQTCSGSAASVTRSASGQGRGGRGWPGVATTVTVLVVTTTTMIMMITGMSTHDSMNTGLDSEASSSSESRHCSLAAPGPMHY